MVFEYKKNFISSQNVCVLFYFLYLIRQASLMASGKKSTSSAGDSGLIPGLGRSHREGDATHSSFLAWEIPGQRSLVGYSPWSHKRIRQGLGTKQLDTLAAAYTAVLIDMM